MAVPKRKMSRASTRMRRAQWKATAATLVKSVDASGKVTYSLPHRAKVVTDSVGTEGYNQGLSERRANAVREVLVNQYGVDGSRVNTAGYGETRPVADNATDAGRAVNRRVEAQVEAQAK
mgnify:CR=1 FL=1